MLSRCRRHIQRFLATIVRWRISSPPAFRMSSAATRSQNLAEPTFDAITFELSRECIGRSGRLIQSEGVRNLFEFGCARTTEPRHWLRRWDALGQSLPAHQTPVKGVDRPEDLSTRGQSSRVIL